MSSSNYPLGFPIKEFGWKGKSFYQVISSIQLNKNNASTLKVNQLRRPLPLNIYRKEIHNIKNQTTTKNCSTRISTKITDIDMPGSTIVTETAKTYSNGLVNTLDVYPTTLQSENGSCNTPNNCFSPQFNARKRVRSSGMIPRKFNLNKNNDVYSTSTQQYLVSRNRSIKQNEYNYIRKGDSGLIPGPGLAASNVYSPAGLSHCKNPFISAANMNNRFSYVWIDGTPYNITIPDGIYDINTLNTAFQTIQLQNYTYLLTPNGSNVFLLAFTYDIVNQSLVLITNVLSQTSLLSNGYLKPPSATWFGISDSSVSQDPNTGLDVPAWAFSDVHYKPDTNYSTGIFLPETDPTPENIPYPIYEYKGGVTYIIVPFFYVGSTLSEFSNLIGFAPGTYYKGINETSFAGEILPSYVPLYFKPNNPSFSVQGAVDASTLIHRIKYNTITDGANLIKSAYGSAAANALSYGVSENAYTQKDVVGDKPIYTPIIQPKTGKLCKKYHFIYRR